jgi:hypothetical protein
MNQQVRPIARVDGAPLVVYVECVNRSQYMSSGVPQNAVKAEAYVCLSALPEELRARVVTACQAIVAGR